MAYSDFLFAYVLSFSCGIGLYFGLGTEPEPVFLSSDFFLFVCLWFLYRHRFFPRLIFGCLLFLFLGTIVAQTKTMLSQAPVLKKERENITLVGQVTESFEAPAKKLILLKRPIVFTYPPQEFQYIQLNIGDDISLPKPGSYVVLSANLRPPATPAMPGAYNNRRDAFFKQIGAFGYTQNIRRTLPGKLSSFQETLLFLRKKISTRITELLPSETAGIATALVLGEQKGISPEIYDLYRVAGIAHVLSVSGFHLTLLAGIVFLCVRFFLSLIPLIALNFSTTKIAAVSALIFLTGYLFLSGCQVPALRAYIMIAFSLLAICLNWEALSLRTLAVAAFLILFFSPQLLLTIGFQLSFIAVLALSSSYYLIMKHFRVSFKERTFLKDIKVSLASVLTADILAIIATTPFVLYHFNQFPTYSVLGNLLTSFLFSLAVIPLLALGVFLIPFGLDTYIFKMAGLLLEKITVICDQIALLPNSVITLPAFPLWGLICMTIGLIMLFLIHTPVKWGGLLFLLFGGLSFFCQAHPDILISPDGTTIAVRGENGRLQTTPFPDKNMYLVKTWFRRNGQNPNDAETSPNILLKKRFSVQNYVVSRSIYDCMSADLVIGLTRRPAQCSARFLMLSDMKQRGTLAVYLKKDGVVLQTSRPEKANRPWE